MGVFKGDPVSSEGDVVNTVGVFDHRLRVGGASPTYPNEFGFCNLAWGGGPGFAFPGVVPNLDIFIEKGEGDGSEEQAGGNQSQAEEKGDEGFEHLLHNLSSG